MARGQQCYYGHNDCTNRKLTALHESYRQGLPDSLGHLIWFVAAYATPFLATFHSQFTATQLVVFIVIIINLFTFCSHLLISNKLIIINS